MTASLVVAFPGTERAAPAHVGGKGASLIRMAAAGLSVPPGVVLTTGFFAPWFDTIQASPVWSAVVDGTPDEWPTLSGELQRLCAGLTLAADQQRALEAARARLATRDDGALFAVRSSAPEEDLATASFAGVYETVLGVPGHELEPALRRCFASVFDERVFAYKREHGIDLLAPRLAVVLQQQVASEIAGVAFSLNPLTNDYDQAVIDASWGLGEPVVAGRVAPDHFVVDKVSGALVQAETGAKQVSIWRGREGGTVAREGYRVTDRTLTAVQLRELVGALRRIEDLFGYPVDIEWAFAGGRLHILQARPITTYVPLAPGMRTAPDQRRRLYADAGLSQGLVINEPVSPLGLAWLQDMLYGPLLKSLVGIEDFTPAGGLVFAAGSRFYLNLSNLMWLGMTPRMMAKNNASYDALLAETLAGVDPEPYRAARRPPWIRPRLLLAVPRALWMMRGFLWRPLAALLAPQRAWRAYQRQVAAFEAELAGSLDDALPLDEFARTYTQRTVAQMFAVTIPTLIAGLISPGFLTWGRPDEEKRLAEKLRRGLTGNLVVQQGIALYRLAQLLDGAGMADLPDRAGRIERREMPAAFLNAWDAFQQRFGCRGPHEMDLASPRYADDPVIALQQIATMAIDDAAFDPQAAHQRNVDERQRAYQALLQRWGRLRRALLRRVYRIIELFGGTRDTPKYHVVLLTYAIRRRALVEGERLVQAGRLDAVQDVFDLTFEDLAAAARNPALDLRAVRAERTRFAQQLAARVTAFPQVIDSRGRILRPPPREAEPGELAGMPVSPGVVTGPVKVLRHPREKPVEPGDVLVAYTTGPGWTPLFVNAAAVVLEVGGTLQHGAVIAREYGKPCVVGIDRVTTRLRDGQRVQVDGTTGLVRLLS